MRAVRPIDNTVQHPTPSLTVRAVVALLAAGALLVGGCGHGGPLWARLHADVQRPEPGVVLFLCDGFRADMLETGCRAGWLPNIQRRFMQGGTHVACATTCIPAITYAAIATHLTGTGPGQHTIVGNCWFDPDRFFFRSYATIEHYRDVDHDCVSPTIYRLMQPAPSANIQTAHHRDVTQNFANWAVSGVMWFFGDYTAVDKLTATTIERVAAWANEQRAWPSLLTCYFPGADSVGHAHGAGSDAYRTALAHVDYQIGRICDWLDAQDLLPTTYLILVSDHGMVDVQPDQRIDLLELVRERWGRHATDRTLQDGPDAGRRAYFDDFDTVVAYHNGRGAFLYLRGPEGWDGRRAAPDEVAAVLTAPPPEDQLWNIPGVALVTYLTGDDEAMLRSARGVSQVRRRTGADGPEFAYLPGSDDVLEYMADPGVAAFVTAGFHPARAWLEATANQRIPDVIPHLIPLLHVHRAGQVVAFTEVGYSFVFESGGHGGLDRDELRIPFMIAGPGVEPGGTITVARSVDLVPTILTLLGRRPEDYAWLEGVSLMKAAPTVSGPRRGAD